MSISTWHNTVTGLYAATHDAYMAKTAQQRRKREVRRVMRDVPAFCQRKQAELRDGSYAVGPYRHFRLRDKKKDCDSYYHIQALADGLGLIVYSTGAQKICKYLDTKTRNDIPLRDMKIVHDWSGFYYDGTVYTDAEEEEMIRKQFNIPK